MFMEGGKGGRRADRSRVVPRGPCDTHVPLDPLVDGVHNNLPCADLWEIGGRLLGKSQGRGVRVLLNPGSFLAPLRSCTQVGIQ